MYKKNWDKLTHPQLQRHPERPTATPVSIAPPATPLPTHWCQKINWEKIESEGWKKLALEKLCFKKGAEKKCIGRKWAQMKNCSKKKESWGIFLFVCIHEEDDKQRQRRGEWGWWAGVGVWRRKCWKWKIEKRVELCIVVGERQRVWGWPFTGGLAILLVLVDEFFFIFFFISSFLLFTN